MTQGNVQLWLTVGKYSWKVFLALSDPQGLSYWPSRGGPKSCPCRETPELLYPWEVREGPMSPWLSLSRGQDNPSLPRTPRLGPCLGLGLVLAVLVLILPPPSSALLLQPLQQDDTQLPLPPSPHSCLSFQALRASAARGVVTRRQGPVISFPTAPGSRVTLTKAVPLPGSFSSSTE